MLILPDAISFYLGAQPPDPSELQKLLSLEKYLNRCADAWKIGDWKSTLRECDEPMQAGQILILNSFHGE